MTVTHTLNGSICEVRKKKTFVKREAPLSAAESSAADVPQKGGISVPPEAVPEPDLESVNARLDALHTDSYSKSSKMARFRLVYDSVERALQRGIPHEMVRKELRSVDLDLSPGCFKSYVQREREYRRKMQASIKEADLDTGELKNPEPSAAQQFLAKIWDYEEK